MNKQKFTTEIRIRALINEAQKELNIFSDSLKETWRNGEPPKRILKEYETLKQRLVSLREVSSKGMVNSSDLARADQDYKAFKKSIHDLAVEFQLFDANQKKAMLGTEEQANIKARKQAIEKYTQSIEKNSEALKEKQKLEKRILDLQSKEKQTKTAKTDLKQRLDNLKSSNGPVVLSDQARNYKQNLDNEIQLKNRITKTKTSIQSKIDSGAKQDGKEIIRLNQHLEELKKQLEALDLITGKADYTKAVEDYNNMISSLEQKLNDVSVELDETNNSLGATENQLEKIKVLDPSEEFEKLKKTLKELGVDGIEGAEGLEELKEVVQLLETGALQRIDEKIDELINSLKRLGVSADEANQSLDESSQALKRQEEAASTQANIEAKIKSFLGLSGAAQVMRAALRDAMQTITELDATMTEMAVVTDLTVGDYWNQLPEYSARASELGVSINSAYKAATLYYQQGLKTNEVNEISTQTLKMAKIANMDAADATNKMTAALRGFNMELNETSAQRVSDVYSELAAITAADTQEIANAMTKTASIASSAGMEFETTAAFLSQIIETTRESAETAGTAMKTVIARFQELKKSPDEIGEVEGEIVDANAIETALRSVGVALRDSKGQFRELDDVFLELSSKWEGLDKNTQRYIATIAAGSRQQSRFIAMMSDYGRTQELVTAANNSAGASQKQFEKTTESLEFKIENLKNAWHEFTMGIMNSELVKIGVDILTKFLEIVNKATNAFDGLGGSITKIASILVVFKTGQKIFEKLKAPLMNFFAEIVKQARETGELAGDAAKEGLEKSRNKESKQQSTNNNSKKKKRLQNIQQSMKIKDEDKLNLVQGVTAELGQIKNKTFEAVQKKTSQLKDTLQDREKAKQAVNNVKENVLSFAMGGKYAEAKSARETALESQHKAKLALEKMETKQPSLEQQREKVRNLTNEKDNIKKLEEEKKKLKEIASEDNKNTKQREKAKNQILRIDKKIEQHEKDLVEESKKLTEQEQEYANLEKEFSAESEKYLDNQEKMWDNIGSGISYAGESLVGVGVAASMLGGVLSELGLTELGEAFSTVGQFATILGSALTALGPTITMIGKVGSSVADKLAAKGWSTQAAWWWIALIAAAVMALIAGIAIAMKSMNDNKIENRMKAAAEATEEAKQAATEAKEAYDKMFEDRNSYDELQKALEDLTYGTKEWKAALIEANAQVLKLLDTYPELAKYISRGGDGQLTIKNEGWDNMLKQQEQAVKNSQALVAARTLEESSLKMENAKKSFTSNSQIIRGEGTDYEYFDKTATKGIREELEDLYLVQGSSLEENSELVEELAKKYSVTTDKIEKSAKALEQNKNEIEQISLESENIAKSYLTALASDKTMNSEFGQEAIDAFAVAQTQEGYDEMVKKRAEEIYAKDGVSESQNNENFKALVQEYGVTAEMTGDDLHDLQELYKAMAGVEEIPDGIAESKDELKKAIAEMDIANSSTKKMDAYVDKLESLNKEDQRNIAGIFSTSGKGMTSNYAEELINNNELDKTRLDTEATKLGYASVQEWADALNMTLDDFYDQAEKNARSAIVANEKTYKKLNQRLGKVGETYDRIGGKAILSIQQQENLGNKILNVANLSGEESAISLIKTMNTTLESLSQDEADKLSDYLGSMNWQDASNWDNLQESLESMGVTWSDSVATFVKQAREASQALEIIDFDNLAQGVANDQKTLQMIEENQRSYSQDQYETLIKADKSLEKAFVQVGEEFLYVGGSMDDLRDAVEKNTEALLKEAYRQLNAKTVMSDIIGQTNERYSQSFDQMDKAALVEYLNVINENAKANGQNLRDFGIEGLSSEVNFSKMSEDTLRNWAELLSVEGNNKEYYQTDAAKAYSNAVTSKYVTSNPTMFNAQEAAKKDSAFAKYHKDALIAQAVQSGVVSNSVIESYSKAFDENRYEDVERIGKQIANAADKVIKNTKDRDAYIDLIDRVTDAIEAERRKEIEKLSELNDSVNSAKDNLVDKISEQIDESRRNRENEKTEKNISDLQARASYLSMDTSGGNDLAVAEIYKQIEEEQQNYQDQLVDQALQQLQDANDHAAQQRERQISLAEAQLDFEKENGQLAIEATQAVDTSLQQIKNGTAIEKTTMGTLLYNNEARNLSEIGQKAWYQDLLGAITSAQNYKDYKPEYDNSSGDINGDGSGGTTFDPGLKGETYVEPGGKNTISVKEIVTDGSHKWNDSVTEIDLTESNYSGIQNSTYDASLDIWGRRTLADVTLSKTVWADNMKATIGAIEEKLNGDNFVKIENSWYAYYDGEWYTIPTTGREVPGEDQKKDNKALLAWLKNHADSNTLQYKTGGLADFTGPAWLDGTPSRPEYVLNAQQTERFFSLIDVLEDYDTNNDNPNSKNGDSYFDIDINVEKIEDDYDIEHIANKIRNMIYEDATYRNVNAINHIR